MDSRTAAILSRLKTPLVSKWMLVEIIDARFGQAASSGRDQTTVTLAPVVNNNPQRDLALKAYVQPVMEGDPPEALTKIRKRGAPFIQAVDLEFPSPPKREGKGVYIVRSTMEVDGTTYEEGQQVDFQGYNAIQTKIDEMVFDGLASLEDKTDDLKGLRLYVKPGRATYSEEWGVSQFINDYALEPRAGQDVADGDDLVDRDAQAAILDKLGVSLED